MWVQPCAGGMPARPLPKGADAETGCGAGHVAKGVTGALDSRYDVARVTGSVLRTACPLRQRLHVQVA